MIEKYKLLLVKQKKKGREGKNFECENVSLGIVKLEEKANAIKIKITWSAWFQATIP